MYLYVYLQIQYICVVLHEMLEACEVRISHNGMVLEYCFQLISQDNLKSCILNTLVSLFP